VHSAATSSSAALIAVRSFRIDIADGVPRRLELSAELLYITLNLGFVRGVLRVAHDVHRFCHFTENLQLCGTGADRIEGLDHFLDLGACGDTRAGAQRYGDTCDEAKDLKEAI
jgi:hypothetical protein